MRNSAPATRVTATATVDGEPRRFATCLKHGEAAQLSAPRGEESGMTMHDPFVGMGYGVELARSLAGNQAQTRQAADGTRPPRARALPA